MVTLKHCFKSLLGSFYLLKFIMVSYGIVCSGHTARKIGFTQIYSVQIWCKKVQTRGKG